MSGGRSFTEQVKYLWNESLERHVRIRNDERVAFDLPLLVVLILAVIAPWLAAGGVIVALLLGYRLEMHRREQDATSDELAVPPEMDVTSTPSAESPSTTDSDAESPLSAAPQAPEAPVPPPAPSEPGTVTEGTMPGEPEEQEPPR